MLLGLLASRFERGDDQRIYHAIQEDATRSLHVFAVGLSLCQNNPAMKPAWGSLMEGSNTIEARFARSDNRWTMAPENGGDSSLPSGPGPEGAHWGCDGGCLSLSRLPRFSPGGGLDKRQSEHDSGYAAAYTAEVLERGEVPKTSPCDRCKGETLSLLAKT